MWDSVDNGSTVTCSVFAFTTLLISPQDTSLLGSVDIGCAVKFSKLAFATLLTPPPLSGDFVVGLFGLNVHLLSSIVSGDSLTRFWLRELLICL